jgi:adenylate cyclase
LPATYSVRSRTRAILSATHAVRDGSLDVSVPVTTSDEIGELADAFNEMVSGLAEREEMRATLGTYLDPSVAEKLVSERPGSGEEVEATVLALDVRGFTAYSEDHSPGEVVAALNRLFDEAVPVIVSHGGTIDKFVGDGLLAVFGVPEPQRDHARRAVDAALALTDLLASLDDCELDVGIGISSGTMLVGNIGGGGRLDFSVIGDAVNLAIRIEEATRESGDAILITAQTIDLLDVRPDAIEERSSIQVKGRREPVRVWGVPRPSPVRTR